jgi:hypothetical protein
MRNSALILSLIAITMAAGGMTSFSIFSIEQQILQASAQSMNSTVPTVSSNRNLENMTFPGQTIVHRGIVSSEEPTHVILPSGEKPHGVSILPHREDGASYSGVLTFTATEPVEIGFSHRLDVDNSTLSQLDPKILDNLLLGQQTNRTEKGSPGVIAIPSVIVPDYGTQPPYFSASLPFAASSVWLRTPHGEPFFAVYEVVAEVVQPQAFVADIENVTGGMGVNMSGVNMSGVNMSGVNMSDSLSQNTTNRTESENMTQQQQEGETSIGQTNATATTGVNTTNQSRQEQQQEQEQNNGNPLSDIPIIGELFGG